MKPKNQDTYEVGDFCWSKHYGLCRVYDVVDKSYKKYDKLYTVIVLFGHNRGLRISHTPRTLEKFKGTVPTIVNCEAIKIKDKKCFVTRT